MLIDMHTHYIAPKAVELLENHPKEFKTTFIEKNGLRLMKFDGGGFHPMLPGFTDKKQRAKDMEKAGIDKAVICVSPAYFYYDTPIELGLEMARVSNDWAAEYVKEEPDRIIGAMATVPMQDINTAIDELDRAHKDLGMNAVEIGAILPGLMPEDSSLEPFYSYCEDNNILIYLHPTFTGHNPPYDKYYNMNLIGYVQETNWAVNRLLFGGVMYRHPNLKILLSHGGGLFPYQYGRLLHGNEVRPETKVDLPVPISQCIGGFYYDTITHWPAALEFLAKNFGADHVMAGTDYPYDMADMNVKTNIESLNISSDELELIKYKNANNFI